MTIAQVGEHPISLDSKQAFAHHWSISPTFLLRKRLAIPEPSTFSWQPRRICLDPINLEEEDDLRARYLEEAYHRTILRDPRYVLYTEVGEALGLEKHVASRIATYLSREGLLNGGGPSIAITHEGTKLVEARIRERKISQRTTAHQTSAIPSQQESRNLGRRVFVVHGRNMKARTALFSLLRAFSLEPIEWSQAVAATGEPTPYVGRVLEVAMEMAHAIVVLFTPDDDVLLKREFWEEHEPVYECEMSSQARPNVIFEAGMALGRYPERTLLVQVGNLKPFSDIAGRHLLRLSNSSESRQQLGLRLKSAGSIVNMDGVDWHRAGDFADLAPPQSTRTTIAKSPALEKAECLMPDLLLEMRKDLRANPLLREVVLLKRSWVYNASKPTLTYYYDEHSELDSLFDFLNSIGLAKNIDNSKARRFVLSEELADYLITRNGANV